MNNLNPEATISTAPDVKPKPLLENSADQKRQKFLQKGLFVGLLAVSFFLVNDLRSGYKLPIVIDSVGILIFGCSYIFSFFGKKHKILSNSTISTVALLTLIALYSPEAIRSIFLAPVTALIAYLLLSRKGGVVWTVLICCSALGIYLFDRLGIADMQLDPELMIFGIITTVLISSLMYVYEGINMSNEQLVAVRDAELFDLNQKLRDQLISNQSTSDKLAQTLEATQKNNQLLSDSKLAVMNVLEDANELQVQLQTEKEGIEQTVLERTEQLRQEQARLNASINSLESGFLMTFLGDQQVVYNPALLGLLGIENLGGKDHSSSTQSFVALIQTKLNKSFDLVGAIATSQRTAQSFSSGNIELNKKFISISGAPIIPKGQKEVIGCVILIDDKTAEMLLERSKDEFITIASHELRTPLTAIRGNADMLEMMYGDKMPDEDSKTMLSDIKNSSVRLISIVNQFLTTSRLEQKRTVFDKKPVDIRKSLKNCANELKGLLEEKKLKLIIKVPDDLPLAIADETRAQEIIVNLLGNAIKYTAKGTITISARAIDGFVQINFTDTGKGIDPQLHHLLFHKFQQASSDILTRDDSRSTGLGLYITMQLVEQMGGTLYLSESKLDEGSTFTFTLPIAEVK